MDQGAAGSLERGRQVDRAIRGVGDEPVRQGRRDPGPRGRRDETGQGRGRQAPGAPPRRPSGPAVGDAVPAEPRQARDRQRDERHQLAGIAEQPEARQDHRQQPVGTARSIDEEPVAAELEARGVGRTEHSRHAADPAEPPERAEEPAEARHDAQPHQGQQPGPPRRALRVPHPPRSQRQDERQAPQVERRAPERMIADPRQRLEIGVVLRAGDPEDAGPDQLGEAPGLDAEVIDIHRHDVGGAVAPAAEFQGRQELHGRQQDRQAQRPPAPPASARAAQRGPAAASAPGPSADPPQNSASTTPRVGSHEGAETFGTA